MDENTYRFTQNNDVNYWIKFCQKGFFIGVKDAFGDQFYKYSNIVYTDIDRKMIYGKVAIVLKINYNGQWIKIMSTSAYEDDKEKEQLIFNVERRIKEFRWNYANKIPVDK